MSWTDERIELLKKLWLDGLSASKIARELGNAVTRNAVIGKVHRMGLSGRAKTTSSLPTRPRVKDEGARPIERHPLPSRGGGGTHGNAALAMDLDVSPMLAPAPRPDIRPEESVVIPLTERVTIMELREAMCKWPMGDPMSPDFRYCGAKSQLGGAPYCQPHARMAYQPANERRRAAAPSGGGERRLVRIG